MRNTNIFVDAHVHMHACFDTQMALAGALKKLGSLVKEQNLQSTEWCGYLMVSELDATLPETAMNRLVDNVGGFDMTETLEPGAVSLNSKDTNETLNIVFGNQLVTSEGLEVLVYGHRTRIPAGESLIKTIEAGYAQDALMILPWGFGKWMGQRGKILANWLSDDNLGEGVSRRVFLGDSATRPGFSGIPALLQDAQKVGIWNLPGSDPLPFATQCSKPGVAGFQLNAAVDHSRPLHSLKSALDNQTTQPSVFMNSESLLGFISNQVRMQVRKRMRTVKS